MPALLEPLYAVMDATLGIFFHLTSEESTGYMLGIFIVATLVSLFITVVTARVVDQKKMRRAKERMKELQERMKKAQKSKNTKEMTKINREMMEIQREMMGDAFKPMIYTIIPIFLVFSWLRYTVPPDVTVVTLPFALPKYGTTLGWFGWYILSSFAVSPLLKKLLNIEGP
ncbi:DUF106 domain-containing protein [Candidatus Pyrohabitans sp.]